MTQREGMQTVTASSTDFLLKTSKFSYLLCTFDLVQESAEFFCLGVESPTHSLVVVRSIGGAGQVGRTYL